MPSVIPHAAHHTMSSEDAAAFNDALARAGDLDEHLVISRDLKGVVGGGDGDGKSSVDDPDLDALPRNLNHASTRAKPSRNPPAAQGQVAHDRQADPCGGRQNPMRGPGLAVGQTRRR
jgi:hypothetical protein